MNTIVYEETLTGRPHDTSVQKATSDNEMWMQFNVMPRTQLWMTFVDLVLEKVFDLSASLGGLVGVEVLRRRWIACFRGSVDATTVVRVKACDSEAFEVKVGVNQYQCLVHYFSS